MTALTSVFTYPERDCFGRVTRRFDATAFGIAVMAASCLTLLFVCADLGLFTSGKLATRLAAGF